MFDSELSWSDFGNVWCAAGTLNFFGVEDQGLDKNGRGWWYHKLPQPFKPDFSGITLVTKTITAYPKAGNMPTDPNTLQPKRFWPDCVAIKTFRCGIVNSVGLTNPGIKNILGFEGFWEQDKPFVISFMAVTDSPEDEATRFVYHLQEAHKKRPFKVPFAIQVNGSCPNAGKKSPEQALGEVSGIIDIFGKAGFLVMLKVNAFANIYYLLEMLSNPYCSGLCTTNSLPLGDERLDKKRWWGNGFPLKEEYGKGGYSGPGLIDHTTKQIMLLRERGYQGHINGGGGIYTLRDMSQYYDVESDSVFFGGVAMQRPWRVQSLIQHGNQLFS